jgi:hypothetical protein
MAAQRRCRRLMGLALTSGPLLVAAVVWASPAQADAASYLNDMHNVGIQDFDGGDAALLQVGHKLCNEIWDGDPPAELAAMALQRSDTVRGAMPEPHRGKDRIRRSPGRLGPVGG